MPKLTLTLDPDEATTAAVEEEATEPAARQRWVLAVEDTPTGDGRLFAAGAFTWRDLPLPFMATDTTGPMHDGARLVANIVEIEREGNEIVGYTENIESDDPVVLNLQKLIANGDLRGVSVDMDAMTGELVLKLGDEVEGDDEDEIRIPIGTDAESYVFTAARIIGATAVPFPAFAEAMAASSALFSGAGSFFCVPLTAAATKEDIAIVMEAIGDNQEAIDALDRIIGEPDDEAREDTDEVDEDEAAAILAAVEAPVHPPAAWFGNPDIASPFPGIRVSDEGRVYGYLALWDTCHVGFSDQCVLAPRSQHNYAAFLSGEVVTDDGSRVAVGSITTGSGHAPLNATTLKAKEHYDHTGWVAADVTCGEDAHGIWIAGAVRPSTSALQLREFMAAKVSGDWRRVQGSLELIAIASVNAPGFPTVQASVAGGAVTALVAAPRGCTAPARSAAQQAIAERVAATIGRHPSQRQAERDAVAARIGRDPQQRRLALAARVKG